MLLPSAYRPALLCVVVSVIALAMLTTSADAQRKPAPACGISYLPMVPGAEWTYEPYWPPEATPPPPARARLIPKPPQKITIRVKTVTASKGKPTEIVLVEIADKDKRETTIKCTGKTLDVPHHSFFYAGEPIGGLGIKLVDVKRKSGNAFPGRRGLRIGDEWDDILTATLQRTSHHGVKLSTGTIELERDVTVASVDRISVAAGTFQATQVQVELRGQIKLNGAKRPFEIPAGSVGLLWFSRGTGVVKARDAQGRYYQLIKHTR